MFEGWQKYFKLVNQKIRLYKELDLCSKRNDRKEYKAKLEEYNRLEKKIKSLENNIFKSNK